jgi:hypothetical protein
MTQNWEGVPDSPEARATLLHTRHILDWSIVQMECARLFALGVPEPEIARRVGITLDEVEAELGYFTGRIFIVAQWKSLDSHGAVPTWLYLHKDCCIPKWEQEVATTDPGELPADLAEKHRELPRWKRWEDAASLREREDQRAPSVRRKPPRRER